jgi:glutamine cyclotransferase
MCASTAVIDSAGNVNQVVRNNKKNNCAKLNGRAFIEESDSMTVNGQHNIIL